MFAAFSPLSGETHLLNATAVWLLELLAEPGWHDPDDALRQVAADSEQPLDEVRATIGDVWPSLVDLGLLLQRSGAGRAA